MQVSPWTAPLRVKLCGIRSRSDLAAALNAGADALGFIVGARHRTEDELTPAAAAALVALLPPFTGSVMVTHLQQATPIIELIREVGALPGVRLSPVSAEADPSLDDGVRRELLRRAYADAQAQAREVAVVIAAPRLRPLEVTLDGNELRPVMMRAVAADAAPPPFDPAELPAPRDRLSMLVRFCAE